MRKNLLFTIIGIVSFGFFAVQCSDDEETSKNVAVSGTVSYDGSTPAAGAVVYLSTSENAADVIATAIADEAGAYKFGSVAEGVYYLSSKFNTENTNLKAGEVAIVFQTASDVSITVKSSDLTQNIALVSNASTGTAIIDFSDGWVFDETHSSIGFNFAYDSANAPFYGQFAAYEFATMKFDEATPSNSSIEINLEITSVETGAPSEYGAHGRDGVNGCIASALGVEFKADAELTAADTNQWGAYTTSAVINNSNIATFKSTSVAAYGNGYVADGTLSFNGKSIVTKFYFQYIEGYQADKTNKTTGAIETYKYSSLIGHAKIKALADFGVSSGHVKSGDVTITFSIQASKKLQ